MKFCAIYARVSSNLQDIENSISAQIKACKEYAEKQGFFIYDIYSDKAESGRVSQRFEFQRMISDAKRKKFEIIYIHKLDRFSRNREDAVTYKALLRRAGVELYSISEALGEDIYSKLIEGILEVVSEFYSLNLAEEVKKGQKQIFSRGLYPGGRCPTGYKLEKVFEDNREHSKIILNPEEAEIIKRVFEMAAERYNRKEILDFLNNSLSPKFCEKWSTHTLNDILRNRIYLGEFRLKNELRIIPELMITTEEIFNRALKNKKNSVGRIGNFIYPLAHGVTFCAKCGHYLVSCTSKSGKINKRYYSCGQYVKNRTCSRKRISAEKLEDRVKEVVIRIFEGVNLSLFVEIEENSKAQIEAEKIAIEKELRSLKKQKENIIEAIVSGFSADDFKEKIEKIKKTTRRIKF